jgi:hypothetical protein
MDMMRKIVSLVIGFLDSISLTPGPNGQYNHAGYELYHTESIEHQYISRWSNTVSRSEESTSSGFAVGNPENAPSLDSSLTMF